MNNIILITCLFFLFLTNAQESEPTFYSEIYDKYAPRDYYLLKKGKPNSIKVNDTVFLRNSEKWIEENIYTYEKPNKVIVKKFRKDSLTKDEIYHLDSNNRMIKYEGNIKYSKGEWYVTKLNFAYDTGKKIIEKINRFGQIYMRYEVNYDSIKNPTLIKSTIVGPNNFRLENINYDYSNGIFVRSEFNFDGKIRNEEEGFINLDYVIEKNKFGDITKMYWVTSDKKDRIIYDVEYIYDNKNNWITMIKTLSEGGKPKKVYSKTHREIQYKK
ncbi:hypothetical protein [uncultured Aquimarina sp.]|uniref:hypothetical protein n=1 Tax=uncultured Aquimarina sp. TaxID=575652 RepID=UPI00263859F1|nr:hypothetical protein [uncultured Aquimarina sp.]